MGTIQKLTTEDVGLSNKYRITESPTPVADTDLANKKYVDDSIKDIGTGSTTPVGGKVRVVSPPINFRSTANTIISLSGLGPGIWAIKEVCCEIDNYLANGAGASNVIGTITDSTGIAIGKGTLSLVVLTDTFKATMLSGQLYLVINETNTNDITGGFMIQVDNTSTLLVNLSVFADAIICIGKIIVLLERFY